MAFTATSLNGNVNWYATVEATIIGGGVALWMLDAAFREDDARGHAGHADQHLAVGCHFALHLHSQKHTTKGGVIRLISWRISAKINAYNWLQKTIEAI